MEESVIKICLTAGTNVGLVRQNNEDNFTVCANLAEPKWIIPQVGDYSDLGEYGSLLVVADGMGGANAGEVASAIAIDTIQESFTAESLADIVNDDHLIQQFMKDVIKKADLNILNHSEQDNTTKGMGTTLVMAWIMGHRTFVGWCGDSRCYLFRQGSLFRLSKDHSYVQELIDHGELHPDLAFEHPLSNIITRCLGSVENRAEPDTIVNDLHNGDILLLCTDGLCGLCRDEQIEQVLDEHKESIIECKDSLISAALEAGGHDNVTVAICSFLNDGEKPEDEEEEKKDDIEENKDVEANELSATVRSLPKKTNKFSIWIFVLVILVVAIILIWYFFEQNMVDCWNYIKENIMRFYEQHIAGIIS